MGPRLEPATAAAAAAAATDSALSVSEKQVLLEYPEESTGGLLKVKMGWGLFAMGANRGELSEERDEDEPMPSLRVERLSWENISRQTGESRLFSGSWMSSRREELLPLNTVAPC